MQTGQTRIQIVHAAQKIRTAIQNQKQIMRKMRKTQKKKKKNKK